MERAKLPDYLEDFSLRPTEIAGDGRFDHAEAIQPGRQHHVPGGSHPSQSLRFQTLGQKGHFIGQAALTESLEPRH